MERLTLNQVCALIGDLKILEDGDQSEIGERGVGSVHHSVSIVYSEIFFLGQLVRRPEGTR